jgi:hypothetical protein
MVIKFNFDNSVGTIEVLDVGVWVSHESLGMQKQLALQWLRGGLRTVVESILRARGVAV